MKANELMIGDWVRCTDPKPFRIEQIDGVEEQVYGDDGFFVDTADLQPIPLTGEILEKNGFKYNDLPMFQYFEQWGLQLYRGGNGFRINCGINVSLIIDSVHQLQHALKLCGIEKEITI